MFVLCHPAFRSSGSSPNQHLNTMSLIIDQRHILTRLTAMMFVVKIREGAEFCDT
jgi:hypothetical protein